MIATHGLKVLLKREIENKDGKKYFTYSLVTEEKDVQEIMRTKNSKNSKIKNSNSLTTLCSTKHLQKSLENTLCQNCKTSVLNSKGSTQTGLNTTFFFTCQNCKKNYIWNSLQDDVEVWINDLGFVRQTDVTQSIFSFTNGINYQKQELFMNIALTRKWTQKLDNICARWLLKLQKNIVRI